MHVFLSRLTKRLHVRISKLSWDVVFLLTAAHFAISWVALGAIGGEDIAADNIFWYFYATTATTVGYGDYSPTTEAGRLVTVLFCNLVGSTVLSQRLDEEHLEPSPLGERVPGSVCISGRKSAR